MKLYIIRSKMKNWIYVGITNNLEKRLKEHNSGKVISTKSYRPLKLMYSENIDDYKSGRKLEKYYKSNSGKEYLKRRGII